MSLSVRNHEAAPAETGLQTESWSFVARQSALYNEIIGGAITELLREASERAFTREVWILDDRFLARIDALCGTLSGHVTVYYGISKEANRRLLRELERHTKQLASGLDVLSAQLDEDTFFRRGSLPRYHTSIASVFNKLSKIEEKLLEA